MRIMLPWILELLLLYARCVTHTSVSGREKNTCCPMMPVLPCSPSTLDSPNPHQACK